MVMIDKELPEPKPRTVEVCDICGIAWIEHQNLTMDPGRMGPEEPSIPITIATCMALARQEKLTQWGPYQLWGWYHPRPPEEPEEEPDVSEQPIDDHPIEEQPADYPVTEDPVDEDIPDDPNPDDPQEAENQG